MKGIIKEHKVGLVKILIAVLLLIEATVLGHFNQEKMALISYIVAYAIIGYEIIIDAITELFKERKIEETLLMTVASLGAMIIGEYLEGILVLVLYTVGEIFEDVATDSSRRSIEALVAIRPDKARLISGEMIDASSAQIGDIIEVLPGERIPLDGDVVECVGMVDTSIMTGESVPVEVRDGTEVLSGYLNCDSVLKIRVKRPLERSAAQRIIDLSKNALERKTKSERFISTFAKIYTPVVIILSLMLALIPPFFDSYNFAGWAYKALSMLAVSCPCAIVISVPLAYFCGIAYASRKGILIKGSSVIDMLCHIEAIAFDKTGTLTKSELHVTKIEPVAGIGKTELLKYACIAEQKSTHPIALAVLIEAGKVNIGFEQGENYKESAGFGVECDSKYGHIKAGNREFIGAPSDAHANIYVSINDKYIGSISLGDELKANSKIAFEKLTQLGIKNKVILSGDKKTKVKAIARSLHADNVYSELTPEGKLELIEKMLVEQKGRVAYCGDGINDTPTLARADIGIAMGAIGSDSAVECSDVVIMDDDVEKVATAIKIAKSTRRTVIANIAISLAIKGAMLALTALGIVPMLGAVLSDVGVLILAIILALFAGR
ncbi:MAG: cadmium-translocating P-type ATPase [Clostridia bacterium]|nr:cadmium-translocating P-type ATPase [Clostridia bacterium]